jgi:hypothetical protein
MLEAARKLKADGADVIVGYVELHGRPETEALLAGLEILPPQRLEHRGIALTEFDLDAALQRHGDDPASTNSRTAIIPARVIRSAGWIIEELLDAGIDVYTTVNVQHLESLNDVVAQITGVQVRETVPDKVFDAADEIEWSTCPRRPAAAPARRQGLRRRQGPSMRSSRFSARQPDRAAPARAARDRGSRRAIDARVPRTPCDRRDLAAGDACWSASGPIRCPRGWCARRAGLPPRCTPSGSRSMSRRQGCAPVEGRRVIACCRR